MQGKQEKERDPTMICCAYKKNRFYLLTQREPVDPEEQKGAVGRDVFNEKIGKEDQKGV